MQSVIIYGFPIILVSFEWLLRTLIGVDTFGFIGPTLAATGISFMVPLTKLKEQEIDSNEGERWIRVSKRDKNFVSFIWLALFVALFLWFWVCTLSLQSISSTTFGFPSHVLVGAMMYLVSIAFCAVKEVM